MLAAVLLKWKKHELTFNSRLGVGYLMLAVMPVAVIMLMVKHTYIHFWMTYRGLALTFASLFMLLTAFEPKKAEVTSEAADCAPEGRRPGQCPSGSDAKTPVSGP